MASQRRGLSHDGDQLFAARIIGQAPNLHEFVGSHHMGERQSKCPAPEVQPLEGIKAYRKRLKMPLIIKLFDMH